MTSNAKMWRNEIKKQLAETYKPDRYDSLYIPIILDLFQNISIKYQSSMLNVAK